MTRPSETVSRRAFRLTLVALIGIAAITLSEFALRDFRSLVISVAAIAAAIVLIIILHRINRFVDDAFSIPFSLYLIHSALSFLTGQYGDFFILCLGICCLAALYYNRSRLLRVIIVINALTIFQIFLGTPFISFDIGLRVSMPLTDALFNCLITLIGSLFVYSVTAFAEDKNNEARNAHDSFVGLLTSTPDPIVLLDPLRRVTFIGNSFMKMLHLDKSLYAKGRSVFDLIKDRNLRDVLYEILASGESCQTTREVVLDGKQHFFEIVTFELVNEIKGYLVNIIDITPVMKAKFEAEAASHSKSAFLATMSHEIRTPLNAIIGLSEIELQKKLSPDTRTDMEKIHHSGTSLLAIINDVLDISKIEAGSFELVPVDYDLPSLINNTVQLNIVRIGSKKITFKLKMDETIPVMLSGDELRVRQVLNNLLSNAFKYTHEGSVVFTVTWEKRGDIAWLTFIIRDSGQGIKKEDLPKLFTEYRQLNARANRHIEGTGLGLSITKNLVSLMNGNISVESEYGTGTVFTVEIPQYIIDERPIGEATARNLELFKFREILQSRGLRLVRKYMPYGKVLVADDVETNLDVARGLMLPYGLYIDTASSGPDAIQKIRSIADGTSDVIYDLVLMDHMMPGMDGVEAVRIIRNDIPGEYGRTVPIIALTANALAGNEDMFLANGFSAFISKPIDILQLDTALNTWVRNKQSIETLKRAEMDMIRLEQDDNRHNLLDDVRLDGIDLIRGRERYNKEAAYLDVLRSWHLHTPDLLDKLRDVSEKNLAEYAVMVHGLKGSSLGICADMIGSKADNLERFAKDGQLSLVQAENPALIKMVESLLQGVGALLKKIAESRNERKKFPAVDPALLAKLLDAVKRYKTTLMEEVMEEIETYEYESDSELVAWLRLQMDNLEYDAIQNRLEGGSDAEGEKITIGANEASE